MQVPGDGTPLQQALVALTFLTRLPLRAPHLNLAACAWAFPLAGLVVGLASGLAFLAATGLGLNTIAGALIALAAGMLLTGALHEDGLADTADGLGGRDRERRLEIMRDSRIGSFGVLALMVTVGLKLSALASLPAGQVMPALIGAAILSRAFAVPSLCLLPPARDDGLGASAARPAAAQAWIALALAIAVLLLLFGAGQGLRVLLWAGLAAAAVAIAARRIFGGQTGDVLGAQIMVAETAALLALGVPGD